MITRLYKNVKDQLLQNKLEYWQKMTFLCHFVDSVTLTLTFTRSLQIQCNIFLTVVSYTRGFQKVRGKVPSYSYFVNQLN